MSVKTYSYKNQGSIYVGTHFQVKEFASFGNGKLYTDTVLIDDELVNHLEKIFSKLNATKAIISSGYRNYDCDKAVGGSGVGQHVNGRAVDICYYDKNGTIIPSKIVICVAYDLGELNGIAKINNNYTHLDNRVGSVYRGDETRGNSSYWTNPYTYFGVSKSDVAKYTSSTNSTSGAVSSSGNTYQSHGVGKNWYPNVTIGSSDYAGVFGVSMDGLYIDNITYRAKVGGKWLPEVNGRSNYVGILGKPITDIAIKGNVKYRVHNKTKGYWLDWVDGNNYNINNKENGYAGNGSIIDAIQIINK